MNAPDPEEETKEVYAHFGLAMFLANCLETEAINDLFVLEHAPRARATVKSRAEWEANFDVKMGEDVEKTFGTIVARLVPHLGSESALVERLREAVARRNWLAHRFFWETSADFLSASGRKRMIAALQDYQAFFAETDEMLNAFCRPLRAKIGAIDAIASEYLGDLTRKAEADEHEPGQAFPPLIQAKK